MIQIQLFAWIMGLFFLSFIFIFIFFIGKLKFECSLGCGISGVQLELG